jgi:hypothetical protein
MDPAIGPLEGPSSGLTLGAEVSPPHGLTLSFGLCPLADWLALQQDS